jgi:predicted N-acetyltransferase YhbS
MLINIRKETENDCNDIKSVNDKVISQKNEYETLSLAPMSVLPNYQKIYFYYRIGSP